MDIKDQVTQNFENELWREWLVALLAGVLHKFAIWVGGGTVTWATIVLMGGFASALPIPDFTIVTGLVLLIIFLLALVHYTCKLVTKKSLSTGSLQPLKLVYQDKRLAIVTGIKVCSFFVQCFVLACTFSVSIPIMLRTKPDLGSLFSYIVSSKPNEDSAADLDHLEACLRSCMTSDHLIAAGALRTCVQLCFPRQNNTDTATTNLQVSLFTFHSLVIFTCILVSLCNLYIFWRIGQALWLKCFGGPKTLSLTRYHDEVLSRSLNDGLVDADEFDEMEFLMQGVGEDLVGRKIAPLEVKRQNEDFIKYSLYHAKGVEMVMMMLASEDTLRQQTAANMPGFWSTESEFMKKVGMELLSKLGEKLGFPGKVAEGAANSFKSLAVAWCREDSSPLLKVYVSRSGGHRQSFGAGESSHTPVLASGEVTSSSLAPIISTVRGGEAIDAVSRSEGGTEGGGGSVTVISRSGGGRDSTGSGSGGAESSQTVASPEGEEGHDHSQAGGGGAGCTSSNVVSVSDGLGGWAGESISTPPESGNHMTPIPQGVGQRGTAAGQSTFTSGGGSRGSGEASGQGIGRGEARSGQVAVTRCSGKNDELKWNVVQKVVDLVANKRIPTLQVYVRALDAFFMSKSVRESLTEEEKDQMKRKLLMIAQGRANQGSGATADHASIGVDSSTRARTKLLAFSALERLGLDPHSEGNCQQLLRQLDEHLKQVREVSVIWIEEVRRYEELCKKYLFKDPVDLRNHKKWKVQGMDFF